MKEVFSLENGKGLVSRIAFGVPTLGCRKKNWKKMMKEISWLHFSDIHFGQTGQAHYWPTYKTRLKEDLKRLSETIGGGWDFVFFSGDLAFSGSQAEYDSFSDALEELWSCFRELGSSPLLLPVPGNHDLTRPQATHPALLGLMQWEQNPELRQEFWGKENSFFRQEIRKVFKGYTTWFKKQPLQMSKDLKNGILPGDFSFSVSKNGIKLGVVGLNSAFLQLSGGDFAEKLVVSAMQTNPLMNNSPDDWCRANDFNILLTHHPPTWLNPSAATEYRSEINPPSRFNLHLYGHLHEGNSSEISEGGSLVRRFRQGPSLLGLEKYGTSNEERIHGYFACKLTIQSEATIDSFWPRRLVRKASGHLDFDFDTKFERDSSGAVKAIHSNQTSVIRQPIEAMIEANPDSHKIPRGSKFSESSEHVSSLSEELEQESKEKNRILPRFATKSYSHHQSIRKLEQATMETTLLSGRCGLIASDWGLGRLGFIGSVIERLSRVDRIETFKVSCGEFSSFDEIDDAFFQQLGVSFQEAISILANLPNSVLILDDFSSALLIGSPNSTTSEYLFHPLLDFCPNLKLIVCTRTKPENPIFPLIELKALELPDVQQYIMNHNLATDEVRNPSNIEALFLKSDGLPMHLDRLMEELRVSSLHEILTSADEVFNPSLEIEPVPLALKKAVQALRSCHDKFRRRSFKLLQVLSFFPQGESVSDLKKFFPNEAFYPQNAVDLLNMDLVEVENPFELETVDSCSTSLFKLSISGEIKRLVVPRQVRDYVFSITSEEEITEITRAALDLFFGDNWRGGNAVLLPRRRKAFYSSRGMGPGNEHAVVKRHLKNEIQRNEKERIRSAVRLAINLTSDYSSSSRYRDGAIAAADYLAIAADVISEEDKAHLGIQLARGYRMTGQKEEALKIFNSIIAEQSAILNNSELAEIELLRALCYGSLSDKENATQAANRVLELTQKGSGMHDHALAVLIGFESDQETRVSKLVSHESEARKRKNLVVANNIALDLNRELKDEVAKATVIQKVIDCQDDLYNRIRALLKKGELAAKESPVVTLSPKEVALVRQAYSFLFTQRLGTLFEDCHEILWKICQGDGNFGDQLIMFRMSSFIWRLVGDSETEHSYASRLRKINPDVLLDARKSQVARAIEYLKKRFLQLFSEQGNSEPN